MVSFALPMSETFSFGNASSAVFCSRDTVAISVEFVSPSRTFMSGNLSSVASSIVISFSLFVLAESYSCDLDSSTHG